MRVIAGAAKGRSLAAPKGRGTRPMTDRVKEALFSSLGRRVADARVLDLYAGSGSLGLEALSRGAAAAVFVEQDRAALHALRANITAVGLGGEVVAADVARFLEREQGPFDLAFVDPPYQLSLPSVQAVLDALALRLAPGATVAVHRRHGSGELEAPAGMVVADRRRYGDAELTRLQMEDR